jgi:hypothetical protein
MPFLRRWYLAPYQITEFFEFARLDGTLWKDILHHPARERQLSPIFCMAAKGLP